MSKEFFGDIGLEPSKPVNDIEHAPEPWSQDLIDASVPLARNILEDLKRIKTTIVFDEVIAEVFPDLRGKKLEHAGMYMMSCIEGLADAERPYPVEAITPEQFNRFAHLYLSERLG